MVKTISVADLERLGACETQVEGFRRAFPEADNGIEVTVENVLQAEKAGLDLEWLGRTVFTTSPRMKYLRIQAQAWNAYTAVARPAWDKHERLLTRIPKASTWPIGVSRIAYNRVENAAAEKHCLAKATAWVEAYEASVVVAGKGDK